LVSNISDRQSLGKYLFFQLPLPIEFPVSMKVHATNKKTRGSNINLQYRTTSFL
ncbi:MAG: hypothetical protein ACI8VW_003999, partial [bacterium]